MPLGLHDAGASDKGGGFLATEFLRHLAGEPRFDIEHRVIEQLLRYLRLGVQLVDVEVELAEGRGVGYRCEPWTSPTHPEVFWSLSSTYSSVSVPIVVLLASMADGGNFHTRNVLMTPPNSGMTR